jgi:endonuclease III
VPDLNLKKVIARLEKHYGTPAPPLTRDPFEMLLLEKAGYLCPDDRRERAFRELKKRVGTTAAKILNTPLQVLTEIAAVGGIYAELRALRMHQSAELVQNEFGGDLRRVLALDFKTARKALAKFPMIGEPGAEKILLFAGAHARLALESNGLRVVGRLGFAEEHKNYSTMYRRAQEALEKEITGLDCERLVAAHSLLRRHGQEICRRSDPACGACPLNNVCSYAARFSN